jgi:hypothetical protein
MALASLGAQPEPARAAASGGGTFCLSSSWASSMSYTVRFAGSLRSCSIKTTGKRNHHEHEADKIALLVGLVWRA